MNTRNKSLEELMEAEYLKERQAEFEEVPVIGVFHPICVLGYILAACIAALAVLMFFLATGH